MQLCYIPKKKYDISDLVLKSILRSEKLEQLDIEFDDESFNPEYEARKKLNKEKKEKKAEEAKSKRDLILRLRKEKKEKYQRKRDSLLKLRKQKNNPKKS